MSTYKRASLVDYHSAVRHFCKTQIRYHSTKKKIVTYEIERKFLITLTVIQSPLWYLSRNWRPRVIKCAKSNITVIRSNVKMVWITGNKVCLIHVACIPACIVPFMHYTACYQLIIIIILNIQGCGWLNLSNSI